MGTQAEAATVFKDEEKGVAVNVGALLQPWFQVTAPAGDNKGSANIGAPDGKSPSWDFFMRRARILVYGNITKDLAYFIETDQPNLGKGGDWNQTMFVQDAFFSYTFMPELKIDAGMMLVPLSHHTIEGAIGLNALDYHADTIRFPAGKIFRDTGIQVRGLAANNLLHYRLGIFEGVRSTPIPAAATTSPLNKSGLPRFAGQIRVNIMGDEPDFFLKGIYFSPKPLISIGLGADIQPNGVRKLNGDPGLYRALSVDAFVEYPFTADDELIFKGNFFNYGEGESSIVPAVAAVTDPNTGVTTPAVPKVVVTGSTALAAGGNAFYAEVGFRHAWVEPLAFIDYVKAKNSSLTILAPHVGCNFWINKHTHNIKVDVGYKSTKPGRASSADPKESKDILATVQGQVFF
jgi:Phosphate-selective porin O and P